VFENELLSGMMTPYNFITKENKAMRKLYGSWAAVLAVLVLVCGITPVRSQTLKAYPTLSLRNFKCPGLQGDTIERVPAPGPGGDRYFLVPVYCYNEVDTNFNPNNNGTIQGQHLEPIRSFNFQFWYVTQAMVLDTGHGSPIVLATPTDTAMAKTFFVQFSDQSANNPNNPFQHVIRISGAGSVPLPINSSTYCLCKNAVLMWLRFKVVPSNVTSGLLHLDSATFNDHSGDFFVQSPTGIPSYTEGNFGGGLPSPSGGGDVGCPYNGPFDRGYGEVDVTAQPTFLLRPFSQIYEINGPGSANDSLLVDLVYDPTVSSGSVSRNLQLSDAVGNTVIQNITISSDQQWLQISATGPSGGSDSITSPSGFPDINYATSFGSSVQNVFLNVPNPSSLAPGVYYATVTFTSYGTSNSPLTLHVRFVRLASPNEPQPGGSGTGIRLNITNSCVPTCTNIVTFGTGPGATSGIDVLYGEQRVTVEDTLGADTNGTCIAYFVPLDNTVDTAFQNPDFIGMTRDIRSDKTDTTLIYQVDFNPGNVNCYPVKVCVDPHDFPNGARIVMKFTLNGSEQGIDLRNATVDVNGMECVTITDHRINHFYIEYTPATIANLGTFLKLNSWTLISLPVVPPNPNATVIFPHAATPPFQYTSQSGWVQPPGNNLEFGRGYMIRYGDFIGPDITVAGIKSYSITNVAVSQGWNSIGGTSGTGTFNGSDGTVMLFTPPANGAPVPIAQTDALWEFTPQRGYDQTNFFTPGEGYFIKVSATGFYNLNTPAPKVGVTHASQNPAGKIAEIGNLQGQLAHVLVRDAADNGQTLYFGHATTSMPEASFEMPVLFHDFDARFEANSGMMSYNHSSYTVDLHAANFPLTMTFTNLSGTVEVTDMNGKVLGTATNNGIVTISDATVKQVRIAEKEDNVGANVLGYAITATENPFHETSTIQYTVPQESVVTLVVYNALGQVVSTLVSGTVGAGQHEALFDGTNLPSGTYYCTMKAGNFVQTQSLSLER